MPRSNTLGIVVRTPIFQIANVPPPQLATATDRSDQVMKMNPETAFVVNVASTFLTGAVVMYNIAYLLFW